MDRPNVFDTKSVKVELQPGEYKWCACGLSKNQPWCDGSHKSCSFTPLRFTVTEVQTKSICLCKQSKNPPYCDGSHKPLRAAAQAEEWAAERRRSAVPAMAIKDCAKAIAWYIATWGAKEDMRLSGPDGSIAYAQLHIGGAMLMMSDEFPSWGVSGPVLGVRPPVTIALQVPDVDAMVQKAIDAGAKVLMPLADQFYGDRAATLQDPFGHVWMLSTHKENVTPDEMQRRYNEMLKGGQQ